MRTKYLAAAAIAALSAAVFGGALAAPATAATDENVDIAVVAGDRFPGTNTQPFWNSSTKYTAGAVVSFNDSDYALTAAGAAAYQSYRDNGVLGDPAWAWNLAPERFSTVTIDSRTFSQQRYQTGVWTFLGTSTRVGFDRGYFTIGAHLYFNVNDWTQYNGKKYIATAWSTDVYPTDTRYFTLAPGQ